MSTTRTSVENTSDRGPLVNGVPLLPPLRRAVTVISTTNIAVGSLIPGLAVDGVTLAASDRVLLGGQSTTTEIGIYIVQSSGTALRELYTSRDFPIDQGVAVLVLSGTAYAGTIWHIESSNTGLSPNITPDIDGMTCTQIAYMQLCVPAASGNILTVNASGQPQDSVRAFSVDGTYHVGTGGSLNTRVPTELASFTYIASVIAAHNAATDPHADRAYTDSAIAAMLTTALDWKASVRAGTTANITLSGAQTIDGVSVIAGNRVLVKNQSTGADNGIYVAASGAWARATDADVSAEMTTGMAVLIEEGTVNGGKLWTLTTANPITLGSTSLTFTRIDAGDLAAASNLSDVASAATSRTNLGVGVLSTKGSLMGATAANTPADVAPGSNGTVPMYDSAQANGLKAATLMGCWADGLAGSYSTVGGNTTTGAVTTAVEYAHPIVFRNVPGAASKLAIVIQATVATSVLRVGVRNDAGLSYPYPGTLIAECSSTFSGSAATGLVEQTIAGWTPVVGVVYWLCAVSQTAAANPHRVNASNYSLLHTAASVALGGAAAGYGQAGITGALSTFAAIASASTQATPIRVSVLF